jgi:hypothetical protein
MGLVDSNRHSIRVWLLLLPLVGCSDDRPTLVPATGKVTMDGKPLTAGAIIFHPGEGNAYMKDKPSSLLQLDGSFTMKTFPFGEGVSPGPYKVTLAPELATRIGKPAYANPDKTPWSVDVPPDGLTGHQFQVADSETGTP